MPDVLVRDLPENVHRALQQQAECRHQSLQQYLAIELRRLAEQRPLNDILDEIEHRHIGRVELQQAVDDLAQSRADR